MALKACKECGVGVCRNAKEILGIIIIGLFLSGCGEPVVDATTDELMKSSMVKVRASLPEAKRAEFDKAVQIMAFSQINLNALLAEGVAGAGNIKGKLRGAVHGKTGNEIIAAASQIKLEREIKQKKQDMQEISKLEEKRTKALQAGEHLKKFQVLRSRFYKKKGVYSRGEPIIDLSVKNGTSHAVSRVYFHGVVASPDREIPWLQKPFNYSIPGGLEPGENAEWQLAPNMFSDWGRVDAPGDAILAVSVERLDGVGGEVLFSVSGFGEEEEKRLAELKNKYGSK